MKQRGRLLQRAICPVPSLQYESDTLSAFLNATLQVLLGPRLTYFCADHSFRHEVVGL
jgi:hypothetical protein